MDQVAALDRGYFVARLVQNQSNHLTGNLGLDNHAIIVPMRYATDAEAMDAIEAAAFHRDPHAMKLIAFIEQQDRYGYSAAWERSIQRLTKTLTWYKGWKSAERAYSRALTEQGRVHAAKRWRNE